MLFRSPVDSHAKWKDDIRKATGRNFQEILRAIDSIQLTMKHQVATPANWKNGEDVIITPAVSDEDAEKRFGKFERVLPYLRRTKQPTA